MKSKNMQIGVVLASCYEGKMGKALMILPYTSHAAFEFPKGFLRDSGCIEPWTKLIKRL